MSEIFQKYRDRASLIRGEIINCTIEFERQLDWLICYYFCHDNARADELRDFLVSDRVDLSKKTKTFISILQKLCKAKGIDYKIEYKGLPSKLAKIYEDRNKFAHHEMPVPKLEEIEKYVIVLQSYNDKADRIPYTEEQIKQIFKRIDDFKGLMNYVYFEYLSRESPENSQT